MDSIALKSATGLFFFSSARKPKYQEIAGSLKTTTGLRDSCASLTPPSSSGMAPFYTSRFVGTAAIGTALGRGRAAARRWRRGRACLHSNDYGQQMLTQLFENLKNLGGSIVARSRAQCQKSRRVSWHHDAGVWRVELCHRHFDARRARRTQPGTLRNLNSLPPPLLIGDPPRKIAGAARRISRC